jgi:S-DNA-T family DNA segregation ATPase FtsK/SpoIIIE
VIRFSAALVAVAIGVLIGGIATSKLLLVYIAIVVSAVALVALAVGVALKREELFGEGQGLVPAGAGASPELPAHAGERQDKVPASAHVAPPPPFPGTAGGHGAAVGGTAPPVAAGAAPSVTRTAPAGQGRSADPVPPWETPAARGPWPSPAPDWMPAGQDERAAGAVGGAGGRAPSAWQGTTPGSRAGGWGVPDAGAQPGPTQAAANQPAPAQPAPTAPRSWAAPPSPAVSSDAPAVKPSAGSGSATPSWFDRLGNQPDADAAPAAYGAASGDTASGGTGTGDEDDDWPTRYSWLDDDTDESGEAGETIATDAADAELESKSPVPGDTAGDSAVDTAGDAGPEDIAPVKAGTASAAVTLAAETADAPTLDAGTRDAGTRDAGAGDHADAAEAAAGAGEPGADVIAFPSPDAAARLSPASDAGPRDGRAGEPVADSDAEAASEAGSEPPPAAEAGAAPGTGLVTVVPRVPRYHRPDCVLIRFMPEGDVQQLPVTEAREAGCTPCAACQPE